MASITVDKLGGLVQGNSNKPTYQLTQFGAVPASANYVLATIEAGVNNLRLRKLIIWNPGAITSAQSSQFQFVRTNGPSSSGTLAVPGNRSFRDPLFTGLCRIANPTLQLGTPYLSGQTATSSAGSPVVGVNDGLKAATFSGVTALATTEVFTTLTAHPFVVGTPVVLYTLTGGTGITAGATYFVFAPTATTFKLASTLANAQTGTSIDVTVDLSAGTVTSNLGVTAVAATDIITSASAHGLVANQKVTFYGLSGGGGLTAGTIYYVIATGLTATAFEVSATLGGSAVNITTDMTVGVVTPIDMCGEMSIYVPTALAAFTPLFIPLESPENTYKGITVPAGNWNGVALRALNGATGAATFDFTVIFTEEA